MEKRQILEQKRNLKMSLRDHSSIKPVKFKEYDQEQQEKHIQSRSRRFWMKLNKRYFSTITRSELQCLKSTLMQEYYPPFEIVPFKQQSYFHKNLLSRNPKLFQRRNIKVLFQNNQVNQGQDYSVFVSYNIGFRYIEEQQGYEDVVELQQQDETFPEHVNVYFMKQEMEKDEWQLQEIQQATKQLQLTYCKSTTDIDYLTQCNFFDILNSQYYQDDIDREIALWETQLKKQSQLQQSQLPMIQKINNGYNIQQDITTIRQFLRWQHNLVNFKNGFADKNQQMLAQALQGMWIKQHKTRNMGQKKKFFKACLQNLIQTKSQLSNNFQTDCKICFSTYVSQKNKVIYCDKCNQSFHQQCYGIEDLNEDPNSKFYCDACLHIMETGYKISQDRIACQICCVPFSPLKKLGKYFFHPSCLFINNLLQPKIGNLQLAGEFTLEGVVQNVKKFEIQNRQNQCEYCSQKCTRGLRFKCSQPSCNKYFHTICAYLNSAVFNIWRQDQKLSIEIRCWQHFPQRDYYRQTYLRRFFCNYRNASDLSQTELIEILKEQHASIKEYKNQMKNKQVLKLKVKRKYNKQKHKAQRDSNSQFVIDLNEDDDQQNTSYQNNSSSSCEPKQKRRLQKNRSSQSSKVTAQQLKTNLERITSYQNKSKPSVLQYDQSLSKLNNYLQMVNMDLNFQIQALKQDNGFLAQLNTNSNDSDQSKKSTCE